MIHEKVAFIGKMFSGKTTAADYLVINENSWKLAFADPVKELSAEILNLVAKNCHRHTYTWDYYKVQERKGEPQVRKLLQLVGTELGRELCGYENVWVDKLLHRQRMLSRVVIDDCRFPNEAQALRENGYTIVRVSRPEDDRVAILKQRYPETWHDIVQHPSETSLDAFVADITINARNLDELFFSIDELIVGG